MKKLLNGISDFRSRVLPNCREKFAELAKSQNPDSLFITCSDSRVAPNWFASTDPGDLFVVRNLGNLVPRPNDAGLTTNDESEIAAVEFAVLGLKVKDIIICGHSECGAMNALTSGQMPEGSAHLKSWLKNGELALQKFRSGRTLDASLSAVNQLSQVSVLEQIENLRTYPLVREKISLGELKLHAWWFDIARADIYSYDDAADRFKIIGL